MKALETILRQSPVFLDCWENVKNVMDSFEVKDEAECGNILFAAYGYEDYEGAAWVLFERNGQLYEVNGSHCSCYGLEGQWEPEKTTLEALEHRLINGTFGDCNYELKQFLGVE